MVVRREGVELGVGEEVVGEVCAGEKWVGVAGFDADEGVEGVEEVGEGGALAAAVFKEKIRVVR